MKKKYNLVLGAFLCCFLFVYSQTDDFTDGNFTANPIWSGDTANFTVLTNGTLPGGSATTDGSFLGSNASTTSVTLTTPSTEVSEWQFSLGSGNFNASGSNSFGVILMSDVAVTGDITGSSWNGYYLKIGVNGPADDQIELWRKTGAGFGTQVGIFLGSPILTTGSLRDGLNIRVTRNGSGQFELFYSTGFTFASAPTTSAGTLLDNNVNTSSYFGVFSRFANPSSSRRVYIDNITIGPTNTSVAFASSTFTAGENNATVDVCVNIVGESASSATSVDVVLTSGSAPHVTYTTQTLTFPAGSSGQQCATINLSQNTNCGDTTSYVFELQSISGGNSAAIGAVDEATLTVNDDDGAIGPFRTLSFEAGDNWNYTVTGGLLNNIAGKFFGTQSYELRRNTLTTENVDISTYTNVTLSVAFASEGVDSNEDLFLEISYDNGLNWNGTGTVKLVDGFSNTNLDIGDTNANTVASNPWTVAIPSSENQIRVRLISTGVDPGEYYYIDDIILSGDTCVTACTPTHSISGFTPVSGPVGTEVTISGSGFTTLTQVEFNGINATTVTFIDTNTLVAEVPNGTTTGEITVTENSCAIDTTDFTVIKNNGNCGSLNNLIMTEIYDASSFSLGYIEVYNGTGAAINLTTYFIRRYGDNTDYLANDYTDYTFAPGVTTIADGDVIYGKISSDPDVATPDFSYGNAGFSGINGDDIFELRNSTGVIDVYFVPNGTVGYTARRRPNTAGPNDTSNPADWFPHSTSPSTADLGIFPYVGLSNFPTVDTSPSDVTTCSTQAVFNAAASPGASGSLTYQWYYNEGDGSSSGWTQLTGNFPLATVSGQTTNQLTLGAGFVNYNNYQFYCLVTENGSCSTASDAAQIKLDIAVWSSSGWSSLPSEDKVVIITDDYDTNVGTANEDSFEACRLIVNSGVTLTVHDGNYVDVVNDVIVLGEILITPKGAFIQRGDDGAAGTFTLVGTGRSVVSKRTAPLQNWYDYTYWSSPVVDALVSNALFTANPNRRFWYNSNNYLDVSPADDIDDNADDWVLVDTSNPSENTMTAGRGYAATHSNIGFVPGNTGYIYDFEGALQTGNVSYPLAYNAANSDHWNLVGNPYPSAINVDDLFAMNTSIKDVVYLWSHHRAPLNTNPGNEVLNFDQNDYILFNNAMPIGNGSDINGDGIVNGADVPEKYIPSGQSFFVSSTSANPIVFKNSLRITGDDSNNQFFRLDESTENTNATEDNKLWINLTSDNGAYGQTGIAYLEEATDGFDGIGFDTKRNRTVNTAASIYTLITERPDLIFGIQAKAKQSLSLEEVIPLGFATQLTEPSIYTLKLLKTTGAFLSANSTYLKDKFLNITHNLNASDYTFTSESGEFNNRFEIVFQPEALSITENEIDSTGLSIIELSDGNVKFSVGQQLMITKIDIIDLIGRTVYRFKGSNSEEVYNLSSLSQSAYIAKVTLSNGQIIVKKAIKSN